MIEPVGRRSRESNPRPRVVLLGASNLARSISTIVETAQGMFDSPLAVLATPGHGRSYGASSTLLGRRLPGIVPCGLWQDLRGIAPAPTFALLTDIGNDLMYGAPVGQIAAWVETCLDRLQAADARIVMTLLPIENIETLSPRRYAVFRSLFFPSNRSELAEVRRDAGELNERIGRLGRARGVSVVALRRQWYGVDPIHLRRDLWSTAWPEILAPWLPERRARTPVRGSLRRWFYLRSLCPQSRHVLGIPQGRRQPAGRLPDGTTIALY